MYEELSIEQRQALDAIRHACKGGNISNSSLYMLLKSLKPILKLYRADDKLRVEVPKSVCDLLNLKRDDIMQWNPVFIGDNIYVIVNKKESKN